MASDSRAVRNVALIFPGQGSQYVGMGRDVYDASPAARDIYRRAEAAAGFDIKTLCFQGPAEVLNDTSNAQPAIVTTSIAMLEALREKWASLGLGVNPRLVAGHSLGEYSALVAAGILEFEEAIRLVKERGRLMKEAGETLPGGMAAVLGLDEHTLDRLCERARAVGIVYPANYNSPGQTVISGEIAALGAAMQMAVAEGARKVIRLAVSIAAHSPVMQRAGEQFSDALSRINLSDARIPLVANVTGQAITSAADVRVELERQITNSVRWAQSVTEMVSQGVNTFVEVGPGQVLTGLVKRVNREVTTLSIGDLRSLTTNAQLLLPREEASAPEQGPAEQPA
jgi:[acyl-carrier-protein] S-malonyltransferase